MGEIPRFRSSYSPRHCGAMGRLLNTGWSGSDIDRYLGEPDAVGDQGGRRFGSERIYLGYLGIPHVRAANSGAAWVFKKVTESFIGRYVKLEGFQLLTVVDRENAHAQELITTRSRHGLCLAEVRGIYAEWREVALVRSRFVDEGPAVLKP